VDNDFYIYVYLDPRKKGVFRYGEYEFGFEPFYVGKGDIKYNEKGNVVYNRCEMISGRNPYFTNKINKIKESGIEPIVMKIKENMIEDDSFLLEIELIDTVGRQELGKGPLVNFTIGGEGISGYIFSEESIESRSKKLRKDFSYIKQKFEEEKCKLLTEEKDYENNQTKLDYICPRGHKHSICWNNFQQSLKNNKCCCPKCNKEDRQKNKIGLTQEIIDIMFMENM